MRRVVMIALLLVGCGGKETVKETMYLYLPEADSSCPLVDAGDTEAAMTVYVDASAPLQDSASFLQDASEREADTLQLDAGTPDALVCPPDAYLCGDEMFCCPCIIGAKNYCDAGQQ